MTEKCAGKEQLFERFTARFDELTAGIPLPSVLVALSGGADSVLLLTFLHRLLTKRGVPLEAYHLDHGIRGKEAQEDAAFCVALCEKLGVALHLEREDVPALAAKEKKGIEECARERRYSALEKIRAERGLSFIATGHNADDQLETMLFRIARGTSLKGLCGIPEKRGAIIRPLLIFESSQIRGCCREQGLAYRQDSTNDSDLYARNDIRHNVLPVLKRVHGGAAGRAAFTAAVLREEEELLSSLVPQDTLCHRDLLALHPAILRRYIRQKYSEFAPEGQLEGEHLQDLCALVKKGVYGKALSLPSLVKAAIYEEGLVFSRDKEKSTGYCLEILQREGTFSFPGGTLYLINSRFFDEFLVKNEKIHKLFIKETCNSATIEGALVLRSARPGDRIRIGGITRKVFSLLGEMRVPLKDRANYPVLADEEGVLWLPGKAPRDGAKGQDEDLLIGVLFEDPTK